MEIKKKKKMKKINCSYIDFENIFGHRGRWGINRYS